MDSPSRSLAELEVDFLVLDKDCTFQWAKLKVGGNEEKMVKRSSVKSLCIFHLSDVEKTLEGKASLAGWVLGKQTVSVGCFGRLDNRTPPGQDLITLG